MIAAIWLDPGSAAVAELHKRTLSADGKLQGAAYFAHVRLAAGASADRGVLGNGVDRDPVHLAVAADDAVAHVLGLLDFLGLDAGPGVHLDLGKLTLVKESFHPLPGGHLSSQMLLVDPLLPAGQGDFLPRLFIFFSDLVSPSHIIRFLALFVFSRPAQQAVLHTCMARRRHSAYFGIPISGAPTAAGLFVIPFLFFLYWWLIHQYRLSQTHTYSSGGYRYPLPKPYIGGIATNIDF